MSYPPRVSFVVSVYNDADRITRSVESILHQTFSELEVILINDGSTDHTAEILKKLEDSDDRICVVHQKNQGLTKALIEGCRLARGEFIARQDSDDWSEPTRVEKQLAVLEDDSIGFVSCSTQYVGPNFEPLIVLERPADPQQATDRFLEHREGPPAHGSVMFRKSLYNEVGGYRPEFYYSQDSDLWLRMIERSLIGYVPEVLYTAIREAQGISGAQRPVQKHFAELCQQAREARLRGDSEEPVLVLASQLRATVLSGQRTCNNSHSLDAAYMLGSQLVLNKDTRARGYLTQVLQKRPWHWKAWVRLLQSYMNSGSQSGEPT